jgi:hypothetical protein
VNAVLNRIFILLLVFLTAACKAEAPNTSAPEPASVLALSASDEALNNAYSRKLSNVWVEGAGRVEKLLKDDNKGARHQKFLVKIASGKTLLFAHNIDLAPRIESLQVGDMISFRGEYVYNPKGGVMHWTHHDPSGRQQNNSPQGEKQAGWIKHNGKTYD